MKTVSKRLKTLTKSIWLKYNNNVCRIPKIKSIRIMLEEGTAGQFLTDDLYNRNYVLYLSDDMEVAPNDYIEEVLFHEFTHLADSTLFLEYDIEKFKTIMSMYSEIHASEIQMDKILSTIENPSNIRQTIPYKSITLKKYLNRKLKELKQEFAPLKSKDDVTERCNFTYIYYFIGYLKSLKKHNIKYPHNYRGIIKSLIPEIMKLEDYLLIADTVSPREILALEKGFSDMFALYYFSYCMKHL